MLHLYLTKPIIQGAQVLLNSYSDYSANTIEICCKIAVSGRYNYSPVNTNVENTIILTNPLLEYLQ